MKKYIAAVVLALVTPLMLATPQAKASPGAYAFVYYIDKGWGGRVIQIKCHATGLWYSRRTGQNSGFCGQNGWVDALDADSCSYLVVRNISTGQVIQYGNGYHGYGPPGGTWEMWVTTRFPNPC